MFAPSVPLDIQFTNTNFWCSVPNSAMISSNVNILSTSFHFFHKTQGCLDSFVSTVTGLQTGHMRNCGGHKIQHPPKNPYQIWGPNGGSLNGDKAARAWSWPLTPSSAKVKNSINRDYFIFTQHTHCKMPAYCSTSYLKCYCTSTQNTCRHCSNQKSSFRVIF